MERTRERGNKTKQYQNSPSTGARGSDNVILSKRGISLPDLEYLLQSKILFLSLFVLVIDLLCCLFFLAFRYTTCCTGLQQHRTPSYFSPIHLYHMLRIKVMGDRKDDERANDWRERKREGETNIPSTTFNRVVEIWIQWERS